MAKYSGQLNKAPAREALIDIQFAPAISSEAITSFEELARSRFEKSLPIWQALFGFSITPDGPAQNPPSRTAIGVRLESSEPPHVLQCRTNGFTFSRLSPYGCWGDLRAAAKKEWDQFLQVAQQFVVSRIAVRYINELKIPTPLNDFNEYLTSPPDVPTELPQAVSAFLQRVVIPDPENDCVSIITQALEEPGQMPDNQFTVLLDVDVFRMVQIESTDSERIWHELDQLRVQKNRMFFAHITDKMVERFK